ncbi:MAG: nitrite reductase, partial [Mammaliicoccus sciuri]|nr:nitrite reductase [Mammaliicoccus sciuri]
MTLANEKVRVAHISELEPLIGKKVIVGDTQIGLFLTEEGNIRAINNVCP